MVYVQPALDPASTAYLRAINDGDLAEADRLGLVLDTVDALERLREAGPTYLRDAALSYAHRGIAVFPCEPWGKRPITAHGLKDASTDPARITAWWTNAPSANIGLPTGAQFDVIDIDGLPGIASIYGCAPDGGRRIDSIVEIGHVTTSRPGGHHIYRAPSGDGNRAALFPGVDYRGAGGYVVAPPSVGANGRRYSWSRALVLAA